MGVKEADSQVLFDGIKPNKTLIFLVRQPLFGFTLIC